jgi:hypothetical protein
MHNWSFPLAKFEIILNLPLWNNQLKIDHAANHITDYILSMDTIPKQHWLGGHSCL